MIYNLHCTYNVHIFKKTSGKENIRDKKLCTKFNKKLIFSNISLVKLLIKLLRRIFLGYFK